MYTPNSFLLDLIDEISRLRYPQQVQDYLQEIFTPTELSRVCARREIIKLLNEGVPQYKIAGLLGVGIGTVTRMSLHLQRNKKIPGKSAGEGT